MASNADEVRREAIRELARRELARRQAAKAQAEAPVDPVERFIETGQLPPEPAHRPITRAIGRQLGLTGRALAEGLADIATPFANVLASGANLALGAAGSDFRFPEQGGALSQALTTAGLPEPEGGVEKGVNILSRLATSVAASGAPTRAVMERIGLPVTPRQPLPAGARTGPPQPASTPAQVLEQAGVPLERSQRTGGRFAQMLRSAAHNNPITAGSQERFAQAQQKAFNRAVLRSIGMDADEATQSVMARAKERIGSVFNRIGKEGIVFDDALQAEIANIVDDARATVPQSELAPLIKNIDDLLNAVDDAGRVNGDIFIRLRSRLSRLSQMPGIGRAASDLEDALLDALERTQPEQRRILQNAVDQWRNLRIIEQAIGRGAERDISPLRLSNALATARNRSMSVFGQGGDQNLVQLAQAGRSVLPQVLPDSGTVPRGLMQAPARAVLSSGPIKLAQILALRQPNAPLPPGGGVLRTPLVAGAETNRLAELLRNGQ